MIAPPPEKDWPSEKLFRLLLRRPRPRLRIAPLSFAPDLPLFVRGLRATEENEIGDEASGSEFAARLVVAVLYESDAPAFASVEDLGAIRAPDYAELAAAIFGTTRKAGALDVVSPTYNRSDTRAWGERLRAGARHPSNFGETALLGQAFDWTGGGEQPDRYFGVPLVELTDGQLMAYRAARDVVAMLRKK